jgi:flagellar motor switch/type III secretory pathway protein FliN
MTEPAVNDAHGVSLAMLDELLERLRVETPPPKSAPLPELEAGVVQKEGLPGNDPDRKRCPLRREENPSSGAVLPKRWVLLPGVESRLEAALEGEGRLDGGTASPLRPALLEKVRMRVKVEVGRLRIPLAAALELEDGAVIELGEQAGGEVTVLAGETPIARGKLFAAEGRLCVRVASVMGGPAAAEGGGE